MANSDLYPRMSIADRAKIFMPFDPLKGFREALLEKERRREAAALPQMTDDLAAELELALNTLEVGETVSVTRFEDGGIEVVRGVFEGVDGESVVVAGERICPIGIRGIERLQALS